MPEEEYAWLPSPDVLSFEELAVVVDAFVAAGVRRVRLTGGEPLVRKDLPALVRLLAARPLEDLALTTNGVLLAEHAEALAAAGLTRVTVSLDTLRADRFERLTRRAHLPKVLAGIEAARRFPELKLDTVVLRGVNDDELVPLLDFAAQVGAELRFIEYRDVGGATRWRLGDVLPAAELLARVEAALGPVTPLPGRGSAPAQRYQLADGRTFGLIASTTRPFCAACDRSRVTADGRWFTCLYATEGVDLKGPLRRGEPLLPLLEAGWAQRADRGAEERLALREARGPLATAAEMKAQPHLEMHKRGG